MKKLIFFIVLPLIVLGGGFFIIRHYFPVALSRNWVVSAGEFDRTVAGSFVYYRKLAELSASTSTPPIVLDENFGNEIRQAALSKLIEDEIIYRVLRQNLGSALDSVVASRLKDLPDSDFFYENLQKEYGVSKDEYMKEVIVPQARKEILEGQLFMRGVDMNKWLADLKKKIWVTVLLPDLKWEEGEVKLR